MEGYLVFTGNEYGLTIEDEIEFIPIEQAEELYKTYLESFGCAVMYTFTGYSITKVKENHNF